MLLWSHNPVSQGAKRLARELGIKRINHRNSRFRGVLSPYVINWGATAITLPWVNRVRLLNTPAAVQRVSDKGLFFLDMEGNGWLPLFTTDIVYAARMIEDGKTLVERHVLNSHGGIGIRIVDCTDNLSEAPLYVEYIKKKSEFRVHLFQGNARIGIIDVQKKIKRPGQEPLDWRVRSHCNGFIYVRNNIQIPACVLTVATQAMAMTALHFGGVDVIYNEHQDRAYVLEINTAPGLEGQTVSSYANAFRELVRN